MPPAASRDKTTTGLTELRGPPRSSSFHSCPASTRSAHSVWKSLVNRSARHWLPMASEDSVLVWPPLSCLMYPSDPATSLCPSPLASTVSLPDMSSLSSPTADSIALGFSSSATHSERSSSQPRASSPASVVPLFPVGHVLLLCVTLLFDGVSWPLPVYALSLQHSEQSVVNEYSLREYMNEGMHCGHF